MVNFFKNLTFFILPLGFGSKRLEFFENQIQKFGGTLANYNENVTYVIIEDSVSEAKNNCLSALGKFGFEPNSRVNYVKVKWLSKCLSSKDLVDIHQFEIEWLKQESAFLDPVKQKENNLEKKRSSTTDDSFGKKQKIDSEKYICSKPSSSSQKEPSDRKKVIIEELEKLANAYSVRKDTWRSHSYKKAINAIMNYEKDISSFKEACSIPGIGEKMALKIMEIIELGKLQKVDEVVDEKTKVLDVFCKIWGAGPSAAEGWYLQGFRSLEDLKANAKLTKQQQIGLKLYNDFQERIPREEIVEIATIIDKEIRKIHGSLKTVLVGSFRRGKTLCGDIDIMIINPGFKTAFEILVQVTDELKAQGLITDDLIKLEDCVDPEEENHHKKYFGVFKLPGENQTHRRIDLFVVPKSEYACALMHYTGSAMFNRSIKLMAAKKDMTLSAHGLYSGTVRKGSEVTSKGQLITTLTEEDIFKELELPYRTPEERDHS